MAWGRMARPGAIWFGIGDDVPIWRTTDRSLPGGICTKHRKNRGEMIATPGRGGDRPRGDDYQYVYPTLRTRHTLGPYGCSKGRQPKSDTIHPFTIKVAQQAAQGLTGGILYT